MKMDVQYHWVKGFIKKAERKRERERKEDRIKGRKKQTIREKYNALFYIFILFVEGVYNM